MVPDYGFMLNNELTDFNRVPAFNPDLDNFNPGANDVAPGKRPRSSMAPTIIFDGKKPVAAFGSPATPCADQR
jgi:gamma-glutamyltranspeptidase/glutathione hydrolase